MDIFSSASDGLSSVGRVLSTSRPQHPVGRESTKAQADWIRGMLASPFVPPLVKSAALVVKCSNPDDWNALMATQTTDANWRLQLQRLIEDSGLVPLSASSIRAAPPFTDHGGLFWAMGYTHPVSLDAILSDVKPLEMQLESASISFDEARAWQSEISNEMQTCAKRTADELERRTGVRIEAHDAGRYDL